MAEAAPVGRSPRPRPAEPPPRPALWLVPPPRPRGRGNDRRHVAFAATLALLLATGIVGVLLLNTAMQTQADRASALQSRIAALALQAQTLQTDVDRASAPAVLAARASALHLRPASSLSMLRVTTAPARAAGRDRAG